MMITLIPTIKEKSSITKAFAHTIGNFMVKDLNNEYLIDSLWIANGTMKIRESSRSKPISITHETDLQF